MRVYLPTQKRGQIKIYEVFISGIFHLIFSEQCWLQEAILWTKSTLGLGGVRYLREEKVSKKSSFL